MFWIWLRSFVGVMLLREQLRDNIVKPIVKLNLPVTPFESCSGRFILSTTLVME